MPFLSCLHRRNKVDPNHSKDKDSNNRSISNDGNSGKKKSAIEDEYPDEIQTGSEDEEDDDDDDDDDEKEPEKLKRWVNRLGSVGEDYTYSDKDHPEFHDNVFEGLGIVIPTSLMINDSPMIDDEDNFQKDIKEHPVEDRTENEKTDQDDQQKENENEMKTLLDVIQSGHKINPQGKCLGERDPIQNYSTVKWITYDQVVQEVHYFASGLLSIGLNYGQETRVAIYAANSPRWAVAQFGIYCNSMILIPLYDRVNLRDYSYIMNETQAECVIVDSDSRTRDVISQLHQTPHVRYIICNDAGIEQHLQMEVEDNFAKIYSFEDILEVGKRDMPRNLPFMSPTPQDLASICFTSGTTGIPKGVLLTHHNYVSSLKGVMERISVCVNLSEETLLSFIPLAHSISLIAEMMMFASGGRVVTYSGEIRHLIQDLQVIKPSILMAIPRFLDNISNRIIYSVKGNSLQTRLMIQALRLKDETIGGSSTGTVKVGSRKRVLRRVVFRKQRARILGGKVKVIINGAGHLSPNVMDFLQVALGCSILDSYGLIECAGFATMTDIRAESKSGHSGSPLTGVEVRLVNIPGFSFQGNFGEILIKGDNVSKGYFDSTGSGGNFLDGWFRTGDIGMWVTEGTSAKARKQIKVIERKENLVKLRSGFMIAPERIQSIYNQSAFVSESFVDSDPDRNFLVAIVVPEVDYLNRWCVQNNLILTTEQACRDILFRHHVLTDMLSTGQREGLKSYEQVRNIYLYPKSFTVENNLLTPNFETRRTYCKTFFKPLIQDLSKNIEHRRQSVSSLHE